MKNYDSPQALFHRRMSEIPGEPTYQLVKLTKEAELILPACNAANRRAVRVGDTITQAELYRATMTDFTITTSLE